MAGNSHSSRKVPKMPPSPRFIGFVERIRMPDRVRAKLRDSELRRIQRIGSGTISERMEAKNTTSPLLALPGELRNEIWARAMHQDWYTSVKLYDGFTTLYQLSRLLVCCKQTKKEVRPFFNETRDKLLNESELVLTASALGDSYLKLMFKDLNSLRQTHLAGIKKLALTSPYMNPVYRQPDCRFKDGSWLCIYSPGHPNALETYRVVVCWKWNKDMERLKRDLMSPNLYEGRQLPWIKSLNSTHRVRAARAVLLDNDHDKLQLGRLVAAAKSEELCREQIQFMLALQNELRLNWP